jgi:hypothetical protein
MPGVHNSPRKSTRSEKIRQGRRPESRGSHPRFSEAQPRDLVFTIRRQSVEARLLHASPAVSSVEKTESKVVLVMDTTLHHRAPNTYSGQWIANREAKIRGRFAVHCP